jgi:branched-chain amino acid transport system ATP-binding protein
MLKLIEVNTYYEESHILHDISLEVKFGEVVALLGRNGVGKTTTIRSIIGLTTPRTGDITFKDKKIIGLKPFQIAREGIGFVPEERWIFPTLTVHQNLLIGMKTGQKHLQAGGTIDWSPERCYQAFPALKKRQFAKGRTLSGGEQQMLTIARTLMGNPELILVDEPTEGLAPLIVETVAEIIREINKEGLTVLLVEQKLPVALELAGRIYVMSKGTVQWHGTPRELQERDEIRRSFLEV